MKSLSSKILSVSIILFLTASVCIAQQNDDIMQAYQRAKQFLPSHTESLVHNVISDATWQIGGRLLYLDKKADGSRFMIAYPATGEKSVAFDQNKLAKALSDIEGEKIDPDHLYLRDMRLSPDGKHLEVTVSGTTYGCNLETYNCEYVASGDEVISPDGTKAVYIKDYNLWMRDLRTGQPTQLTFDGQKNYGYGTNNGGWIKSKRPVVRWSPDSKHIATFRQDSREVKDMYLVSTNVGHPRLEKWKYALPGDSAIFRIERVIINLKPHHPEVVHLKMQADAQRSTISDHIAGDDGSFLDTEWFPDSDKLAFVSVTRNLQKATLRIADPQTGDIRTVLDEQVKTFYESGENKVNWHVLPRRNEIIWYSQRSNWGHLYMYNLKTGELKYPITKGDWNVLQVRYIDKKDHKIYFTGSCRQEGNPYFHYLYSIDFSGKHLKLLTPETANHVVTISTNGKYFVDTYSTTDMPPVSVVRNMRGKKLMTLEKADISDLKAMGWKPADVFTVKARDGKTTLYGKLFTPTNFDSTKSYPVIDYIYPGPQTGSVRTWSFNVSMHQSLAELGFIIVEVNALGTPGRSKAFQDYWYGNMHDNGLPDQVAMIKQLAKRHSWIDINRVGIWGHSGGGFASTDAMLSYPDFFKVAVSESGNHDNRNYEANWGDKYQGLLKMEGDSSNYTSQANEVYAKNLKGHLLLACGLMDNNVPPSNTLLVADALIKANKDFDMFIIPNARHGYGYARSYFRNRRWAYFLKYLKGENAPHDFEFGSEQ
ncbi:MAG TPA: DPP IV N-terminal domain-containing protein [Balneolales bacterium]|nr:DPP IV N-terminal domain-containing protein [Balneolales bacterium]